MLENLLPELERSIPATWSTTPDPPRILVADDQPHVLDALCLLIRQAGYQIKTVNSPEGVLEALRTQDFDVLLIDLNYARDTTSGKEGLDLLSRVRALNPNLPVVVMTGWASVDLAVEAMHRGVRDFVQKPWDNRQLLAILRSQVEQSRLVRRQQRLQLENEREFEAAREIQQRLLPTALTSVGGIEVSGSCQSAAAVGGDYFDILRLSDCQLALCIGDVAGKGMPATLLMANLQAAVKAFAAQSVSPQELCRKVNGVMSSNTATGKFISFFYGLVDTESRKVVYTNAGHNAPVLLRQDGTCLPLKEGGAVLGVFPEWEYQQGVMQLNSGDRLVLFTDGVTEATSAACEEFGEERLIAQALINRGLRAASLQKLLMQAVTEFSAHFQDDATLMVMAVE
jgi:sigma-B regulation protein RsbU (phosphoserine phosphatase)